MDEGIITQVAYGSLFRIAAIPRPVPYPLLPPALARFVEMQLSVSHQCGESGAERQPGFCRVLLAVLVFD